VNLKALATDLGIEGRNHRADSENGLSATHYPHPTKPGVLVTQARICQLRHIAAGNCQRCGRTREHYAGNCDECQARYTAMNRTYRAGQQPWQPGSRGRKPYVRT
jgi:hypothetical protein